MKSIGRMLKDADACPICDFGYLAATALNLCCMPLIIGCSICPAMTPAMLSILLQGK
ncbi:hypothetical protein [Candidatus Methanoliparum sp. LAM-1]|uniref:hypothetical protein n=1 Tax=Candidatus Methanoliparum sp. LAM-1 TaxID=2874846 RepID=UPI001E4D51CB|nr:hypothetical protein [Candidatus Methanoliparum sp. LAM-1]BDC36132.1 hypothetical protein MTLP_08140 [Candidatus Methanoliparum sp. LAM-1]